MRQGPRLRVDANAECGFCRRRRVLLVYHVRRVSPVPGSGWRWAPFLAVRPRCLDRAGCRAYVDRQREKAARRSGVIVLHEALASRRPFERGVCTWCGDPIVLADAADYRRRARTRHYGDEHEVGDRRCATEFDRSRAFNARQVIELRGDESCIDCGADGWDWEADHDLALEDGGAHCASNIVRRCRACHLKKTARENRDRARRRREAGQQVLEVA